MSGSVNHVQMIPNTRVAGKIILPLDSFSFIHIEVMGIESD